MSSIEKSLGNAALKVYRGFIIENDINPSEIDHLHIKNILLVVRHQMGDMLCALPMMNSIRNYYSQAEITLVTKESTKFTEIFENENSPVNEVLLYEHGFENFLNLTKGLREKDFDLAIVPSTVEFSATNHLIAYHANARYRAGVRSRDFDLNKVSYLLNIKSDFLWSSKKIHQIERNLDVIRQLKAVPVENTIRVVPTAKNENFAEKFLSENFTERIVPIICFHPGAGKEQNMWPVEKFAKLAKMLYEKYQPNFLITEGPSDKLQAGKLHSQLSSNPGFKCRILKTTLDKCSSVLGKMTLFVTNDTGLMHLASGTKVPVVAVFGPTRAEEWGPVGDKMISVQSKDGKMASVDPESVFEACKAVLED